MISFKKKEKTEKPSGEHGSHFDVCFAGLNLVKIIVMMSVNKPDQSKEYIVNLPDFKNAKLVVNTKIIDESLLVTVLLVNGQLYSSYPINRSFTRLKGCKNPKVVEWKNELEGWISVSAGNARLDFFPIDYYKNKEKYNKLKQLSIGFSGIAYSISKAQNDEIESKYGKFKTDKMACLLPINLKEKNTFPDDYFFRGEVLDIQSEKVDGKSFFVKV